MTPITRHQRRLQDDQRGATYYIRRRYIDQKLRDMRLQRYLKEVWQ